MEPIDRHHIAQQMHETALTERVEAAAEVASDPSTAVEYLEMTRALLHRHVDEAIDNAQLSRPSATRPVVRARRYREVSL